MDKQNFYRRQKLSAPNHLQPFQDTIESTLNRLMADVFTPGWDQSVSVVQNTPSASMHVKIASAPYVGMTNQGERIYIGTNDTIPISGITLPTAGNQKIVTVLVAYDTEESSPVVTPLDGTINYDISESYTFSIIQGTQATTGTAEPPADPGDGRLILCDITISEGTTTITNSMISTARQTRIGVKDTALGIDSASLFWNTGKQIGAPSGGDAYYLQAKRGLLLPPAGFRILEGADPETDRPILQAQKFTDHETYTWEEVATIDPLGTVDAENVSLDTANFNGALSPTENTAQKAFDKLDEIAEKKPALMTIEYSLEVGFSVFTRYADAFKVLSEKNMALIGIDQSQSNKTAYMTTFRGGASGSNFLNTNSGNSVSGKSTTQNYGFVHKVPAGASSIITQVGSNGYSVEKDLQVILSGDMFGGDSSSAITSGYSSSSTSFATVVETALAVSNASNKVLVIALFSHGNTSSSPINDFTLAIDGTAQDTFQNDFGETGTESMGLAWLFTPGDTSSHNYQLRAKCNSGTLALISSGIIAIEIPAALASSISSNFSGAGQKRNTITVAADSQVLALTSFVVNTTPNAASSYVACKYQIGDVDKTSSYQFCASTNGSSTLADSVRLFPFLSAPLSAGSHNIDAEFTENGTGTLVQGRLITIEVPAQ